MSDFYQLAIIAFILLGVFIAWRAGQANPEGTGRLARRIGKVETELKDKATTADVAAVKSDVGEVEGKITALQVEIAGDRRINQLTYDAVRRLEDYFLRKGTGVE